METISLIDYIRQHCKDTTLNKWTPIRLLGQGVQSQVWQVCKDEKQCNYVIKLSSPDESHFAIRMGALHIAPFVHDSISCGSKVALISTKMEGDLSTFFFPPVYLDEIFPQVLFLIYTTIVKYKIIHRDTKINNFLYIYNKDNIKVYLSDFGLAQDLLVPSDFDFEPFLIAHLRIFNKSFLEPHKYGIDKDIPSDNDIYTFMKAEKEALASSPDWAPLNVWYKLGYSHFVPEVVEVDTKDKI